MIARIRRPALCAGAIFVASASLNVTDDVSSLRAGSFAAQAEARVGRPMTPISYAGVARRTTRRTAAVAAGAVAYGATAGGCQQVVDVYGRVLTQCY